MKNIKKLIAVALTAFMLCGILSGCGGVNLDENGYITVESAKSLAENAVKDYIKQSDSITEKYMFYSSESGSVRPDLTDDEHALIINFNTQGSQILVTPADGGESYEDTSKDIVVLVSSDGKEVTVVKAPDMKSSPVNPIPEGQGLTMSDIEGYWKYDTHDNYYAIYETGEWALYDMENNLLASGSSAYDSGTLRLHSDDLVEDIIIVADSLDRMTDNDGDSLSRYNPTDDDALSRPVKAEQPYFEKYNLSANYTLGDARTLLRNGFSAFSAGGKNYTRGNVYWEVVLVSDVTSGTGIREIEFEAICYITNDDNPSFAYDSLANLSQIYDYRTGVFLPAFSTSSDTDPTNNSYSMTVEYGKNSYDIEWKFSTNWENNKEGCARILYKDYIVQFPVEYDGLMFCMLPEYSSYNEYLIGDTATDALPILDCPGIDAGNALRCFIG